MLFGWTVKLFTIETLQTTVPKYQCLKWWLDIRYFLIKAADCLNNFGFGQTKHPGKLCDFRAMHSFNLTYVCICYKFSYSNSFWTYYTYVLIKTTHRSVLYYWGLTEQIMWMPDQNETIYLSIIFGLFQALQYIHILEHNLLCKNIAYVRT